MFAVIKTGGKQYKVKANDVVEIEKIGASQGDEVKFDQIMMIGAGSDLFMVGNPFIKGAYVKAEVLSHAKADKIIVFKKKRRHNYRRKAGHRQNLTNVLIKEIIKS